MKKYTLVIRPIDKPLSDAHPIRPDDFIGECFDTLDELKKEQDNLVREWLVDHGFKPNQKARVYQVSC